jgi:hypothetical protein
VTHTITLASDVHVSKTEALRALSTLFDTPIDTSDPANAVLTMDGGVVMSIEVPKFGEDLPLTLDLTGSGHQEVSRVSDDVVNTVAQGLGWTLLVVGGD